MFRVANLCCDKSVDQFQALGHLLCSEYINPALAAPDEFGIVEAGSLTDEDRKRLVTLAKILHCSAINMGVRSLALY